MNPWKRTAQGFLLSLTVAWMLAGVIGCRKDKPAEAQGIEAKSRDSVRVIGLGRIEPELKLISLAAEGSGTVERVAVQAGAFVSRGQALVELSSGIQKARLAQAAAGVSAQASDILAARAALAAAQVKKDNSRKRMERLKSLYEKEAQTQSGFDDAKAEFDALAEDVKRLEAVLAAAQGTLKKYEADQALARAELEQRTVRAPIDGQVLSLDVTPGAFVSAGVPLGTFAAAGPLAAWCEVDEMFASLVRVGQDATVRAQGTAEPLARGRVVFAGPSLRQKSLFADAVGDLEDRRVREVCVRLEAANGLLFGSRIECVIEVGPHKRGE